MKVNVVSVLYFHAEFPLSSDTYCRDVGGHILLRVNCNGAAICVKGSNLRSVVKGSSDSLLQFLFGKGIRLCSKREILLPKLLHLL